jgi:hypothetical protein
MAMGDNVNPRFPPRLANWLLRWFVPAKDREEIMGDLAEEFSLRVQSSNSCWSWYWGQTLRSIPPMAWKATRQWRWIRTFLVALGAYIAAGLVESMADAVLLKTANAQSLSHTILSLIIGLTTTAGAGYVAARFRSGAETVMAAIVLLAVTVLLAARVGEMPLWYGFAFLIAGPLASLAGGALFLRSRT